MKSNRLSAKPVSGGTIWVNGTTGRVKDLITKKSYGDCEVHVEFFIPKGSNSGIKFHAVYEIQIHDSFGVEQEKLKGEHSGRGDRRGADSAPDIRRILKACVLGIEQTFLGPAAAVC